MIETFLSSLYYLGYLIVYVTWLLWFVVSLIIVVSFLSACYKQQTIITPEDNEESWIAGFILVSLLYQAHFWLNALNLI